MSQGNGFPAAVDRVAFPILREERHEAAMHSLLAASCWRLPVLYRFSLALMASLRTHGRLVSADLQHQAKDLQGLGLARVACVIPLASWLRGPDERISRAVALLAGPLACASGWVAVSVFVAHWARALLQGIPPREAWPVALARLARSAGVQGGTSGGLGKVIARIAPAVDPSLDEAISALMRIRRHVEALSSSAPAEGPGLGPIAPAERVLIAALAGAAWGERAAAVQAGDTPLPEFAQMAAADARRRAHELPRLERWPTITSQSHPLPLGAVAAGTARIALCPCPGQRGADTPAERIQRDLELDVARLREWGARHVLCLLPNDTIIDAGIGALETTLAANGIRLWHLPLAPGLDGPWIEATWRTIEDALVSALRAGQSVVVHGLNLDEEVSGWLYRLLAASNPMAHPGVARRQAEQALQAARGAMAAHDTDT